MNRPELFITIVLAGIMSSCDPSAPRAEVGPPPGIYAVIDLSPGPDAARYEVEFLDELPADFPREEHRHSKLALKWIQAGSFEMGQRSVASPVRSVKLSHGFYMALCEITQAQWELVMGPHSFHFDENPTYPAESISWDLVRGSSAEPATPAEASFLGRLSSRVSALRFDLPTEAQWEYACRASTTTDWSFGNSSDDIDDHLWSDDNSDESTQEVGTLKPNPWGLFDLHGNVAEWCLDRHGSYPRKLETDPAGPSTGWHRIWRGGSWDLASYLSQSAMRSGGIPSKGFPHVGFRPVSVPSP